MIPSVELDIAMMDDIVNGIYNYMSYINYKEMGLDGKKLKKEVKKIRKKLKKNQMKGIIRDEVIQYYEEL